MNGWVRLSISPFGYSAAWQRRYSLNPRSDFIVCIRLRRDGCYRIGLLNKYAMIDEPDQEEYTELTAAQAAAEAFASLFLSASATIVASGAMPIEETINDGAKDSGVQSDWRKVNRKKRGVLEIWQREYSLVNTKVVARIERISPDGRFVAGFLCEGEMLDVGDRRPCVKWETARDRTDRAAAVMYNLAILAGAGEGKSVDIRMRVGRGSSYASPRQRHIDAD